MQETFINRLILAILLCLLFPIKVVATTIVDTGPGKLYVGWALGGVNNQSLSSEFVIGQDTTINSIEGWMDLAVRQSGHIAIYQDGGEIPGTELYSVAFFPNNYLASWQGIYGLNWTLSTGTYWVAFESRPGDYLNARMGYPSTSPLGNEAVRNKYSNNTYKQYDTLEIGVRITGQPTPVAAPVPEPATMILFGAGLVGITAARRRKKA